MSNQKFQVGERVAVQVGNETMQGVVKDVQDIDGKNVYDVSFGNGTGIAAFEDMMAHAPTGGKRKTKKRKGKARRTRRTRRTFSR